MNKKLVIIFILLIVVLSSAMTGLFFVIFEQRESERDIGLHGEAAFNPLLVAQRFLEQSGIESESIVSMLELKEMPEKKDILFLATRRFDIGPALREKIMSWVSSGGHLIVVAWPHFETHNELQDPIMDELGLTVKHESIEFDNDSDNTCEKEIDLNKKNISKEEIDNTECEQTEIKPIAVTILKSREKSEVAFDPSIWLKTNGEHKTNWVVSGEHGAHLVEFVRDKGLITVLSDYQFLTNMQLNKYDHAAFLWYLVHYSNNSGKVWMIFKGDMPPLYEWFIKYLWAPFLMLFFIIVIWIWRVISRFGSLYPDLTTNRRNLIEHIRASGQFLWRNKFSHGLIRETRNALQEKITKRHPNWNKLTNSELYSRLAKQTGLTLENIEFALTTEHTTKENEFFLIIQTLERLRKSL